jgi:hypothetical protein
MSEVIEIEGETIPYQKVIVQGPVDFLRLVVLSVLIGLFFGVIATLITKNQRSSKFKYLRKTTTTAITAITATTAITAITATTATTATKATNLKVTTTTT